jgi:hypothetical protein
MRQGTTVPLANLLRALPRTLTAAVVAAALCTILGACYHPSPPVGLANCYEGLPLAETALDAPDGSYQFHGVKMVRPDQMERLVQSRFPGSHPGVAQVRAKAGSRVCAFAFTGHFAAGQVAGAPAAASGKAAVVLITTDRQLLFSFVLATLPERFSRSFAGV